MNRPINRRVLWWGLAVGGWTLLGLLSASRLKLSYAYTNNPLAWTKAIAFAFTDWYSWALLSPIILWLARRFPFEPRVWWRGLLVQLPASVVIPLVKMIVAYTARRSVTPEYARRFPSLELPSEMFTYWAIVGVIYAYDYYRKYRAHELRASQLAGELAEARLQALRMQINPHFLFNTLHAISSLMRRDVEAADRMIAELSDLLRLTLDETRPQEVPLRAEIEFLKRYLEIEQMRFRERLEVRWEIAPETLDAQVPHLILQPLVENAVKHGIAPRAAGGRIEIRAVKDDGRVLIDVSDDGGGFVAGWRDGVGLRNTRARLAHIYGAAHRLTIGNTREGGAHINLSLPWRTAETGSKEGGR